MPLNSVFSYTVHEIKFSWRLLGENWRAFLATEIFSLIAFFLTFISLEIIINIIAIALNITVIPIINVSITYLSNFIGVLVFYAFMTCQYGLAYDMIASGDMFAEFKVAFPYFRNHWWRYIFLTLITQWLTATFHPHILIIFLISKSSVFISTTLYTDTILILVARLIFYLFWFIFLIETLPSVTAKNSLLRSFKENREILGKIPRQSYLTLVISFVIFIMPQFLAHLLTVLLLNIIIVSDLKFLLSMLLTLLWFYCLFIGTPMIALITTRIYNSVSLDNEGAKIDNTDKETN